MARNLKDAFYNAQFRVGQGIYTRAVSQGAAGSLTQANFESFDTFTNLVDDASVMNEFAGSQLLMEDVSKSSKGMETVAASQTARDVIGFSGLAYDTIANSNMAIGKYAIGYTTESPSDFADMDAVVASQTAMNAVAASQTAMDAVMPSLDARTRLTLSSFARDSLWTASTGSQRYWDEGQTFSEVPSEITFEFVDVFANSAIDFRIDFNGVTNQDRKEGFGLNLDFDQIDQLKVDTEFTGDQRQGANFLAIFAGATELFAIDTTHSQTTRTLDTSSISGTKELQLVYEQRAPINDTFQMIFGLVSAS